VRILLDEQLPRWAGLRNGELLLRATVTGFDVLLTADQNLTYQQNLARSPLRVVVLVARSNKLEDQLPLVPAILAALQDIRPGEVCRVGPD
jgi:hypothetical protein